MTREEEQNKIMKMDKLAEWKQRKRAQAARAAVAGGVAGGGLAAGGLLSGWLSVWAHCCTCTSLTSHEY